MKNPLNIGISAIIVTGLTCSTVMQLMSYKSTSYAQMDLHAVSEFSVFGYISTLLLVGTIYYKWCSRNIHIMFMPMFWGAIFGLCAISHNCMMLTKLFGLWMRCIEGSYDILEFNMCNHEFNNLTVLTLTQYLICSQTIMTVCLHIIYFIMVYDDRIIINMLNKLFKTLDKMMDNVFLYGRNISFFSSLLMLLVYMSFILLRSIMTE